MIQIVHVFIWFAQVIVVAIYMGIALVVCASGEKPPKEATPEQKETPAEKDEPSVETADAPTGEDTDDDCSNACEHESEVCLERCYNVRPTLICRTKCKIMEYRCYVNCVLS